MTPQTLRRERRQIRLRIARQVVARRSTADRGALGLDAVSAPVGPPAPRSAQQVPHQRVGEQPPA